jgi:hypothetical protein
MIPQDSFIIVAEVEPRCLLALRSLLKTMTIAGSAGVADPANSLVRFSDFETIHFARFVVLADNTLDDRRHYPQLESSGRELPTYLCFMVDCDGDADELLARMVQEAAGLRTIFGHCKGLKEGADMLLWLRVHRVQPMASYINWVGRSVAQVREEACLHKLLRDALPRIHSTDPQKVFALLKCQLKKTCTLTAAAPTPLAWRIRNLVHMLLPFVVTLLAFVVAALCLVFFPLITIALLCIGTLVFVIVLRRHEQSDPIVCQPYERLHVEELRHGEDHDVTNQYTAMGSIKPGLFRLRIEIAILYGINWVARHIFTRGSLARIGTIHFAHWVFLDQRRRGFFCSNYDGGHEAYMDDFINKAGFGLNLAFSSFIGYPTTNWLVASGAWREQGFKRFQRHHQIPTDVWYKAYPGLTAHDLARNSRIRNGFEKAAMSDDEVRRWLAEI